MCGANSWLWQKFRDPKKITQVVLHSSYKLKSNSKIIQSLFQLIAMQHIWKPHKSTKSLMATKQYTKIVKDGVWTRFILKHSNEKFHIAFIRFIMSDHVELCSSWNKQWAIFRTKASHRSNWKLHVVSWLRDIFQRRLLICRQVSEYKNQFQIPNTLTSWISLYSKYQLPKSEHPQCTSHHNHGCL